MLNLLFTRKNEIISKFEDIRMVSLNSKGYKEPKFVTTADGLWAGELIGRVFYEEGLKRVKELLKQNPHRTFIRFGKDALSKASTPKEKAEISAVNDQIMIRCKQRLEKEYGEYLILEQEYKDILTKIKDIVSNRVSEADISDIPLDMSMDASEDVSNKPNSIESDYDDIDLSDI